jgi:hypothetical protein
MGNVCQEEGRGSDSVSDLGFDLSRLFIGDANRITKVRNGSLTTLITY